MKTQNQIRLIAIVGGSGAGKSWLADRLYREFDPRAARLSLDDFYHDFSHVAASRRDRINFDDPSAIDWAFVETALRECRAGNTIGLPRYNFLTHMRFPHFERWKPKPVVFMDGLWLLWRPSVRSLFDLRIFLDCPEQLRWRRRLARDVTERGRTPDSVREQFWNTVVPMHDRYITPQIHWADIVLPEPPADARVRNLTKTIDELLSETPKRTWEPISVLHEH